jgi:hypothetical protein
VPVIVKPATSTAWLTQRMVKDVVDAGIFPAGALSIICGSSAGLLDQLQPFDVVSFTGSADTAAVIRSHPAVVQRSVRVNIEADSVNSALLLPSARQILIGIFIMRSAFLGRFFRLLRSFGCGLSVIGLFVQIDFFFRFGWSFFNRFGFFFRKFWGLLLIGKIAFSCRAFGGFFSRFCFNGLFLVRHGGSSSNALAL